MAAWLAVLNEVVLSGGDSEAVGVVYTEEQVKGCLTSPPDGLGVPPLRTEDQTYPQKDGAAHFADWYEPRIVTLANVSISPDGCPACPSAKEKAALTMLAWSRHCEDTELVIWTDCLVSDAVSGRAVTGPFGVRGRPRVAELSWRIGKSKAASALLRFDSIDHRLYILDEDGEPGSGEECLTITDVSSVSVTGYAGNVAALGADSHWPLYEAVGSTVIEDVIGSADGVYGANAILRQPGLAPGLAFSARSLLTTTVIPMSTPKTLDFWYARLGATEIWALEAPFTDYSMSSTILVWASTFHNLSLATKNLLESGDPCYVAITADGVNLKVYVNGVLRDTFVENDFGPGDPLTFSTSYAYYSDVAAYPTALSAADITTLYAASGAPMVSGFVNGTLSVPLTITFNGPLTNPKVTNVDTGEFLGLTMFIPDGQQVIVYTEDGTADLVADSIVAYSVIDKVTGDPFLTALPGDLVVSGTSEDADDTGTINICWRPAVVSA